MFLLKVDLKICSKFTGEHPCRSVISIKLQSNFIEISLRHGCSPVNLLHFFGTPLSKNTSGGLLLTDVEVSWHQAETDGVSSMISYTLEILLFKLLILKSNCFISHARPICLKVSMKFPQVTCLSCNCNHTL